ncbi:MAG TPA: DegT/DnrJ/EryC1/StrS aminotransferase family protein [Gemmatimonadaceae bacterium]|nr:DegT/DnrJ/EryC1/StrS aminotransferase family protein [Gemmatimonadaceae bacterium]
MLNTPFPPWPSFTEEEASAIARVLRSNRVNYWTGTEGREFESEFAAWVGAPYAIALNNGSIALEAALRALRIGSGDEVIVTPRTFIASASSVALLGGVPVFADVDPDTQNLTAESMARVVSPRTRAIILVHLAGMPCDMDPILDLASAHGLSVIEDCAQAHGARYKGCSVGALGDVGAWSFCQDKIMTTGGEGGMVTTRDEALWSAIWSYKDHGKDWSAVYAANHEPGFRWVHNSFGTNGRMLEVQAAIGRIQLTRMSQWTRARRANAERIWSAARDAAGLRAPVVPAWAEHGAYKAYVFVDPAALKADWTRDRIMAAINQHGVPCYSGSCSEVYLERAFDTTGWRPPRRLPVARLLGETSLMFLVHPTLESSHIDKACSVLSDVMQLAVR